jgi:hypothetical protein
MAKSKSPAEAMVAMIRSVTADWAKQRRSEERHVKQRVHRADRILRRRGVSLKEAAFQVMEEAYAKASDRGALPANARQIMYAARPDILRITGKDSLDDAYFTQRLLPDFIEMYPKICGEWDVVYDARGSFIEPHTRREVAIGTIEVRDYVRRRGAKKGSEVGGLARTRIPDGRAGEPLQGNPVHRRAEPARRQDPGAACIWLFTSFSSGSVTLYAKVMSNFPATNANIAVERLRMIVYSMPSR